MFKVFLIDIYSEGKSHERYIYDLLNFIGDVGGLFEGLSYPATVLNIVLSSGLLGVYKGNLYLEITDDE